MIGCGRFTRGAAHEDRRPGPRLPVGNVPARPCRRRQLYRRPFRRGSAGALALQRRQPQGIWPRLELFRRPEARQDFRQIRRRLCRHRARRRGDRRRQRGRGGRQHLLPGRGGHPGDQQERRRKRVRRLLHGAPRQSADPGRDLRAAAPGKGHAQAGLVRRAADRRRADKLRGRAAIRRDRSDPRPDHRRVQGDLRHECESLGPEAEPGAPIPNCMC